MTMPSTNEKSDDGHGLSQTNPQDAATESKGSRFAFWKRSSTPAQPQPDTGNSSDADDDGAPKASIPRSKLGILNDKFTDEVPGSILLLSGPAKQNEPLGLQHTLERTSSSSLPSPYPPSMRSAASSRRTPMQELKRTASGKIILEPQPESSMNDPLNWPRWRRDMSLLCIGFYSMLGGGMTPVLAAGFSNVAQTYHISVSRVSLTTGLYMMGLGVSNALMSPTAILWGKRPVYLAGCVVFILSAVWCALSPSFTSLLLARIFMGLGVAPVECLPSASVAEIFFLHERAYRLGIYTLLLLSGKNLVPLVSAAIIQSLGWRHKHKGVDPSAVGKKPERDDVGLQDPAEESELAQRRLEKKSHHVGFADNALDTSDEKHGGNEVGNTPGMHEAAELPKIAVSSPPKADDTEVQDHASTLVTPNARGNTHIREEGTDYLSAFDVPPPKDEETGRPELDSAHLSQHNTADLSHHDSAHSSQFAATKTTTLRPANSHNPTPYPETDSALTPQTTNGTIAYMHQLRHQPPKSYLQTLRPWNGRVNHDLWWKAAVRPFILFAYPGVLWSALVYALSIGWLIVLSEAVTTIYRNTDYHFSALGAGLVYISPFIGGILGTAVAGKVSDFIVRWMSRRNDGIYEPEFRLVMVVPVAGSTVIGLFGFGWSAQERDAWIVPTVFFGIISFGCSLGSTTAITFCVDSYRQYAGEALVTLNFSKNIFHGLIFSLFFTSWLEDDGAKKVFLAVGGIQLGLLLFTIPMYIYGKRARMWTVRKNLMERF
ncbi:MAG: hypothetical protein M1821_004932 [Bathelium mastoideum]|nr:MAG: hypothetical protein M1821_004932 [Bathelium mastoideum]